MTGRACRKYWAIALVLLTSLIVVVSEMGCATTSSSQRVPVALRRYAVSKFQPKTGKVTPEPSPAPVRDTVSQPVPAAVAALPDEKPLASDLIILAEQACQDSSFDSASTLLDQALKALATNPDTAQETATFDAYQRIAQIYADCMPSSYIDSIPDEISTDVFQRKLARSLDSMKIEPSDSAAIVRLICQSKVTYDIPITWNDRVLRSLRFFKEQRKGPTSRWLARAPYYLPFMQEMLREAGLPLDLAYLPMIESGYNPNAYSRAHAAGLWQFIPGTGKRYGLRQSYWLDERRDPIRSTRAGISYLKTLHNEFGDWYLAMASYNCGEGNTRRAIVRADTNDFWQLHLPRETAAYVPEFIAALIVAKNPQCFGYALPDTQAMDLDTVHFSDCLDLKTIAEGAGSTVDEIRSLNPHILRFCTPPDADDVVLYLPRGSRDRFLEYYADVPDSARISWYRYRVAKGDNIGAIARRFKMPVDALKSVNNLRSNRIVAGHYLLIPIPTASGTGTASDEPAEARAFREKGLKPIRYRMKSGETLSSVAGLFRVSTEDIQRWNELDKTARPAKGSILTLYVVIEKNRHSESPTPSPATAESTSAVKELSYTVQSGDSLTTVARSVGATAQHLAQWNEIVDTNQAIYPGQVLVYQKVKPPPLPDSAGRAHSPDTAKPSTSTALRVNGGSLRYRVKQGDNLSKLARLFRVKVSDLISINDLPPSGIIRPGSLLTIPASAANPPMHEKSDLRVVYYEVQAGDALWDISRRFDIPISQICELNGMDENGKLMPGDTIRILRRDEK